MRPIERKPVAATRQPSQATIIPSSLMDHGIYLGINSRVLKLAKLPKENVVKDLFSTLEVNMDLYTAPSEETLKQLLKGPYHCLIWHVEITDLASVKALPPEFGLFLTQLMEDASATSKQQLFILSLHPTVTYSSEWLDQLLALRDALPFTYLLETAHRSWKTEKVQGLLRSAGIDQVGVDAPKLFGLIKEVKDVSGKRGYLRILGRNSKEWFEAPPKKYEHRYNAEEITEIAERILRLRDASDEVTIIVCNHPWENAQHAAQQIQKQVLAAIAARQE
jgi:uncharacterized protein YecE (DUF72 family)